MDVATQRLAGSGGGRVLVAVLLGSVVGALAGLSAVAAWMRAELGGAGELPGWSPWAGARWLGLLWRLPAGRWALEATAVGVAVALGVVLVFALVARGARGARGGVAAIAHGSARWATRQDASRAGLFANSGVVLGRWGRSKLVDASEHHVLILMPTGAGKSTGPILSTLLSCESSAVVLDPKGELWASSAGWRASRGHHCLQFSPTRPGGVRWNPLDEIERGPGDVAQLVDLARNLITYPAGAMGTEDSHWLAGARSLFVLLCLHAIYAEAVPATLAGVRELLNGFTQADVFFNDLIHFSHNPSFSRAWKNPSTGFGTATHPEVARQARRFLATPDRERGSLVSTLQPFLDVWGDPEVARNTAESDFRLDEVLGEAPVTLYATVPYQDLARIGGLMRLLLTLLFRRLAHRTLTPGTAPRRLELLLDEFASLGRLPVIEESLAFLRGYGARCTLAVQDLNQIRRNFGREESITGACQVHLAAATQQAETRSLLSKLTGTATASWVQRARLTDKAFRSRWTYTPTAVSRPLLTEGEVGLLPANRWLLLKRSCPPLLAERIAYFEDPELARRAQLPPPSPAGAPR